MSALLIQDTLSEIECKMTTLAPYRRPELFNQFLPQGYASITLNSVSQQKFSDLLQAKLCLGTLITLYDDFADRPLQSNPKLLERLYQLSFGNYTSNHHFNPENHVIDFAQTLFRKMEYVLSQQPNYLKFVEILNYDLSQFYSANRFSSLLMGNSYISNSLENKLYMHHNMGMIMVWMMDLMATDTIKFSEFGAMREVFLMGQRMGRIFNVLSTYQREINDGDFTGELAIHNNQEEICIAKQKLKLEISQLRATIMNFDTQITTFSVKMLLEGLRQVQLLHERMEGVI